MKILLLAQKTLYSHLVVKKFLEIKDVQIVGLVYSSALLTGKTKWQSFKIILAKGGWGVIIGKVVDMLFSSAPKMSFSFPVIECDDVNNRDIINQINKLKPDLIFSIFFNQVLKKDFLKIPSLGVVNIHPSLLPQYRGVGPTFWVLAYGENETGVTYHFINERIDEGDIIKQEKVVIKNDDTVRSLYLRCAQTVCDLLPQVLEDFKKGRVECRTQDKSKASYFGMPDRKGFKLLRQKNKSFIALRDVFNFRKT